MAALEGAIFRLALPVSFPGITAKFSFCVLTRALFSSFGAFSWTAVGAFLD